MSNDICRNCNFGRGQHQGSDGINVYAGYGVCNNFEPTPAPNRPKLAPEVVRLVIAGRELFDTDYCGLEERREFFDALEAFASRVPYADEPATEAAPASARAGS